MDRARVTDLQGVRPLQCWMAIAGNFYLGIQRVEKEVCLFFLCLLLGTQHGYPGWDLTPRTTQGLSLFCLFVFLRMECPQKNGLAFLILVFFFLCDFFLRVAQPCWHSDTVGLFCGTWPGQSQAAETVSNHHFSHGSGKCPYPEYSFPSFVVEKSP